MLWVLLALLGAVANAAYYILIKRYIHRADPRLLTAAGFLFGSGLLFGISALQGFPTIGSGYWPSVCISALLNIAGLLLIFKALSSSDLSLSMPMLSFTPAFLVITSYLILHEFPTMTGIAGILIIVSGSYVLNFSGSQERFLDPFRSMLYNRGSWYMLIVAFLFAASINFDRIALQNSDAVFGMAFTIALIGAGLLAIAAPAVFRERFARTEPIPSRSSPFFPGHLFRPFILPVLAISAVTALECISINIAYTLQIVPYVIAIKRLNIIFMVLYGTLVCAEDAVVTRIAGSGLMVAGAVVILLFG